LCFLGHADEGLAAARKLIAQHPDFAQAYLAAAVCSYKQGLIDRCISYATKAIRLDAGSGRAYLVRCAALYVEKRPRLFEALRDAERCISLGAYAGLEAAREPYLAKGMIELELDRPGQAMRSFALAAQLKNGSIRAKIGLTECCLYMGRFHLAHAILVELKKAHPNQPQRARLEALALLGIGKIDEALFQAKKGVHVDPKNSHAHCRLADVYLALGRYRDARRHYDNALAIDPDCWFAQAGKAFLLATCPSKEQANAQEAVALALELNKDFDSRKPRLLMLLATAYAAAGRFDAAVQTGRKALLIFQADSPWRKEFERRVRLFEAHKRYLFDPKLKLLDYFYF
jgi:tetratricopeptide (TPR) repeat protein